MEKQDINLDKNFAVVCPHCNTWVLIEEINCGIFRHGVNKQTGFQIPPHLDKESCDRLFSLGEIYGCGKPFKIVSNPFYSKSRTDDANLKYFGEICEYI